MKNLPKQLETHGKVVVPVAVRVSHQRKELRQVPGRHDDENRPGSQIGIKFSREIVDISMMT
jgi:hypothetical protein